MQSDWKTRVPEPIFESNPDWVALYYAAWDFLAQTLIENPAFPHPFCFAGKPARGALRRLSDACFLTLISKYGFGVFPGAESLANVYAALEQTPDIPFELSPESRLPLLSWAEYEYALISGDIRHIRELLRRGTLQSFFETLEALEALPEGEHSSGAMARRVRGYCWEPGPAGIAGSPRGLGRGNEQFFWLDLLAQQSLSALCISRLAALVNNTNLSAKWRGKFSGKKTLLRRWYWNSSESFFFDIDRSGMQQLPHKSCAGFWPLLSACLDLGDAEKMAKKIFSDPSEFGGMHPFPGVARSDAAFDPGFGASWRGAISIPMAYVALRGLSHYGLHSYAHPLASALLNQVAETYRAYEPHTFWDFYDPRKNAPALPDPDRPDGIAAVPEISGISTLAPINIFIENGIGIHGVDAFRNLIEWSPPKVEGRVGLRNLRFGENVVDLVRDGSRCYVRARKPFTIQLYGERTELPAGSSIVQVPEMDRFSRIAR